ncbi:hypothetical protein FSP39_009013 [Pinctada imbricata]|uniref:Uncharacterized protein n=1 Tax=Pinctada imbricata TaxID=66713 RepID=A0AA89BN80_PINIB|nr:hypothetical protein FSP39_009013 [Pinctada imbricata]
MVDFDKFEKDIRATFDLLDDIKSGEGLNWDRINKFFESPLFKRRNNSKLSDKFSSFPSFRSRQSATTESSETDSGDEVFSSRSFRRSDSTYSTSSYDTTDSSDTVSGDSTSSRFQKRQPKVERQIPVQHYRTASTSSSQGLSKKLENQFLNEERHSVPHEIYSDCDREGGSDYLFRPVSAPPKPDPSLIQNRFNHDSKSSFKCFPSRVIDSQSIRNTSDINSNSIVNVSNFKTDNNRPYSNANSARSRPEVCQTSPRANSRGRTLPDVLKKEEPGNIGPPSFGLESNDNPSWQERQGRIECALKWLRSELGLLRAQDKVLLSQLKRCQDTIEVIKKQREEFNEIEEDDEGHWEDWEIAEFDRRCENGEIIDDLPKPSNESTVPNSPGIRQDIQVQI